MFAITYNSIWTPNASSSNIYLIKLTELAHMILKYKKPFPSTLVINYKKGGLFYNVIILSNKRWIT